VGKNRGGRRGEGRRKKETEEGGEKLRIEREDR
jgi:hypothetical protein